MATYTVTDLTADPQRSVREDQLRIVDKIFDFKVRANGTTTAAPTEGYYYDIGDVFQLVGMRSGWTVMGLEVEILRPNTWGLERGALDVGFTNDRSTTGSPMISIGTGADTDRFGYYKLDKAAGWINPALEDDRPQKQDFWWIPLHLTSSDTIDIKLIAPVESLGPNLVTGSTMAADTGWTLDGTKWDIAAGVATRLAHATVPTLVNTFTPEAYEKYLTVIDYPTWTAGNVTPSLGGVSLTAVTAANTDVRTETRAINATGALTFTANATGAGTLDNVYAYKFRRLDAKFKVRVYYLRDGRYSGRRN